MACHIPAVVYGGHQNNLDRLDPAKKAERLARIAEIEDETFQTAAGIVQASLDFYQVEPNQEEPPPEWIEQYGARAAMQRLRVAKASWLPQSVAPSGVKLAAQVVVGISRARRLDQRLGGSTEINVKLQLPAPTSAGQPGAPEYPVKEIE